MKFLKSLLTLLVVVIGVAALIFLPWPALLALVVAFALWLAFTRRGRQTASIAGIGVSTLAQRLGSSAVIVIGIAGVVGVLVAMLSMAQGYADTLRRTGGTDSAIVMRGSSAAEVSSVLARDDAVVIAEIGRAHV